MLELLYFYIEIIVFFVDFEIFFVFCFDLVGVHDLFFVVDSLKTAVLGDVFFLLDFVLFLELVNGGFVEFDLIGLFFNGDFEAFDFNGKIVLFSLDLVVDSFLFDNGFFEL